VNLYGFVGNDGVNWVDILGLNVYAIDGTDFNVRDNKHQNYSNTHDIHERALAAGEKSQYYGGPGSDSKTTLTLGDLAGKGMTAIIDNVVKNICEDYCADQTIKINLFGWSRGAIAAVEVARKLNEHGCKCSRPGGVVRERRCIVDKSGNEKWQTWETIVGGWTENFKPVPVNFVGLYDAVEMVPQKLGTPDMATKMPGNVKKFFHAAKTTPYEPHFPTQDLNPTRFHTANKGNSTHGDIGVNPTNTAAHGRMIYEARNAGVNLGGAIPTPDWYNQ
jgi:hypothetical protein